MENSFFGQEKSNDDNDKSLNNNKSNNKPGGPKSIRRPWHTADIYQLLFKCMLTVLQMGENNFPFSVYQHYTKGSVVQEEIIKIFIKTHLKLTYRLD